MATAISVKNLTIEFNKTKVLDDISFDIPEGDFVFVVGPNSSGKSTLIKSILGIQKQKAGNVRIYDKENNQQVISEYFGYVPQYTVLDRTFPITVDEFISLECEASHCARNVSEHFDIFGDKYLLGKKLKELSGGEMQKVLIAKALVTDPKILVLDEPGNHLDHESQTELYSFLRDFDKQKDKTILIITHDLNAVEKHAAEVLLVENRKVEFKKILDVHHTHV